MIGLTLNGGLGNLLFIYAHAYYLSKKLNTSFVLIKHGEPVLLYRYFNVERNTFYYIDQIFFEHKGFKLFFSHYLRKIYLSCMQLLFVSKVVVVNNIEDPLVVLNNVKDGTVYEGYFQSELYFKSYANELKQTLTIKEKYANEYLKNFDWLKTKKKIVTIHIRRTDYKDAFGYLGLGSSNLILPFDYYHQLIKEIHHPLHFYVFISDDIAPVKAEFAYLPNTYFSEENEITDFQLMLNADICIIANSSFSWWAAYLNKRQKTVYCPKYYLGFLKEIEYPTKIYPENWIQIAVR